jgi:hypothetical protein
MGPAAVCCLPRLGPEPAATGKVGVAKLNKDNRLKMHALNNNSVRSLLFSFTISKKKTAMLKEKFIGQEMYALLSLGLFT